MPYSWVCVWNSCIVYVPYQKDSKKAEPFGDESKRHAKLRIRQRTVEIVPHDVTKGGVITGQLFVGNGAAQTDIGMELLGSGFARLDQIKEDYSEVAKLRGSGATRTLKPLHGNNKKHVPLLVGMPNPRN